MFLNLITKIFSFLVFFPQARCEDENSSVGHGEHVWLIHRGGFCAAIKLSRGSTTNDHQQHDKVTIKLLHNGEELSVDEDDIEKSNPSSLDLVEDICQLKHLNEASILHCLRQRYASNLIHTKAGPILVVVNPMAPLSLYSEKVSVSYCLFVCFERNEKDVLWISSGSFLE